MLHNILPKPPLQSKHLNIAKTKHTELTFHQPQQEWHKKKSTQKTTKVLFLGMDCTISEAFHICLFLESDTAS